MLRLSRTLCSALIVGFLLVTSVVAQQHRATRLGNPATRFAEPIVTPEDLRERLTSERLRADVASILRQGKWTGDIEDFRRAAATAEIVELKIPVGTRLRYMSSRENGKPIVLWDVLWAGKEPIDAYTFVFVSKGRHYRCTTPKACSNFWVEDMAPPAQPGISLALTGPGTVRACDPLPQTITVKNTGNVPLGGVQISQALPEGLTAVGEGFAPEINIGTLQPGETRQLKYTLAASKTGGFARRATVRSTQGISAEASTAVEVKSPSLSLDCQAPAQVFAGRPAEFCLVVKNSGDAADDTVAVLLPLPAGSRVQGTPAGAVVGERDIRWEFARLGPGETQRMCVTLIAAEPGAMGVVAEARGACSPRVESRCRTAVAGIPAILLEVIDLQDPIEVGSNLTYEVRVENQGSAPGTNIRVVCRLESTQEFVSGSGPTTVQLKDGLIDVAPLPSLAPKATATWKIVIKALKAGDVRFASDLTSDQIDRPVQETEATQQY